MYRTPQVFYLKNFRKYLTGQVFYFPALWIGVLALMWETRSLTDSAFLISIVSVCFSLPYLLLAPITTAIAEIYDRRNVTIITQVIQFLVFTALTFITIFGHLTYAIIIIFALLYATGGAIQEPARMAFLNDIVGKEHIVTASSMGSVTFNIARALGPIAAGFLLQLGPVWCFSISALLTLIAFIMFAQIKTQKLPTGRQESILQSFSLGAKYIAANKRPLLILLVITASSALGYGATILMTPIAKDVMHMESVGYGLLQSTVGFGALCGALFIAFRGGFKDNIKVFSVTALWLPINGFAIALTMFLWPSWLVFVLYFIFGLAMVNQNVLAMGTLSQVTESAYIGRVMGFYSLALSGLMPIGSLVAGGTSELLTIPIALMISYSILTVIGIAIIPRINILNKTAPKDKMSS